MNFEVLIIGGDRMTRDQYEEKIMKSIKEKINLIGRKFKNHETLSENELIWLYLFNFLYKKD